jgi:hypothetical protein
MQERQVAEAVAQPEVADRRLGVAAVEPFESHGYFFASQATAVFSSPSWSTSLSAKPCRPVNTRPSATFSSAASSRLRRFCTNALNQAYESITISSTALMASGLVGSKLEGAALSGDDFTVSTLTPMVFRSSVKFGYWNRTPIEPTSEVSCATM